MVEGLGCELEFKESQHPLSRSDTAFSSWLHLFYIESWRKGLNPADF